MPHAPLEWVCAGVALVWGGAFAAVGLIAIAAARAERQYRDRLHQAPTLRPADPGLVEDTEVAWLDGLHGEYVLPDTEGNAVEIIRRSLTGETA